MSLPPIPPIPPTVEESAPEPDWAPMTLPPLQPPRSAWREYGRNLLLFVFTAASVYVSAGPGEGLRLVVGLMTILLSHEMGHYLACLYYGVDATLPFFIPAPVISFVGTLGAFIRIRSPFPNRRSLFDIGIAGPLAGFAVCLPVLYLGIREAKVIPTPPLGAEGFLSFGYPLLLQWALAWLKSDVPRGMTLLMGPLLTAAWFGLFVTALNLIPIGQLDGGHVTYALFGRRAHRLSRLVWWACVGLIVLSPSWILWAVLLRILGRRHPPTLDDHEPLGNGRRLVAFLGLVVFASCFVPSPLIGSWGTMFDLLRQLRRH